MAHHRQASKTGWAGLARALSKLGFCSRSHGKELILAGRVQVNGNPCRDPERRVNMQQDRIEVDARAVQAARKVYIMLNKPRGLVTTVSDEHGRATVFDCLKDAGLPTLSPVGRLDKASEGLLLFSNDTAWAAHITNPDIGLEKVYHVQVDSIADAELIVRMERGTNSTDGEFLQAKRAKTLRSGSRNSWLEVVLTEGKNRHIRRLLAGLGIETLRLVRIAIGSLQLGNLPKGAFRHLTEQEKNALVQAGQLERRETADPKTLLLRR
jgi:23S rRNA pseudouridine2605 synthase